MSIRQCSVLNPVYSRLSERRPFKLAIEAGNGFERLDGDETEASIQVPGAVE